MKIIGRIQEKQKLKKFLDSNRSEFLAIYGRRRVGKSFLIENSFQGKVEYFFSITGIEDGGIKRQLIEFSKQIGKCFYKGAELHSKANWFDTFEQLTQAMQGIPKNKKVVLFFDEFPWMATPRSRLLPALEYYWNQFWVKDGRIKLIICGSSASWIIRNIVNNTGGLYNRITYQIGLHPFSLCETSTFLETNNIRLTNRQVLQLYMVLGGIPLYLEQANKGKTAAEIIDKICFTNGGMLIDEFKKLFKSLFKDATPYMDIIRVIANYRYGIGKQKLASELHISNSGRLTGKLEDLEEAGFIVSFLPYQHKEKGAYYRVIDEYIMFYLQWIEPNKKSIAKLDRPVDFWIEKMKRASYRSWSGYTFESVCYKHVAQIKNALSLKSDVIPYTWRYVPRKGLQESGAQIDLLFDRDDDAITVCEIKYTDAPFAVDKSYAKELLSKVEVFKRKTRTTKQIFIVLISVNGIKQTMYSEELVTGCVTLDDLFKG